MTGRFIRTLTGFGDHVTALAFRPDGRVLACGSSNGEPIRLLDPISGELHGVVTGSAYDRFTALQSLSYSPDGRRLVGSVSQDDSTIRPVVAKWRFSTRRTVPRFAC